MRYAAERVGTREWLHHDLPLSNVERTRTLSGPAAINANIPNGLRHVYAPDGLRVLEESATYIYCIDDNEKITNGGLLLDVAYDETGPKLTCAGFATYPHGYPYLDATNWGPIIGSGTTANPETPRPDPLVIAADLWTWVQSQPSSDLGVTVVGDRTSTARIGDYEEPYRLRWWELPDVGAAIDDLARFAPFDYAEEYAWVAGKPAKRLRFGFPRLGTRRTDLRFALGENVTIPPEAGTTGGAFANHVIGIGNGEGRAMIRADSVVDDGRLRRIRVVTDKTIKSKARMQRLVTSTREKMATTLDVTSVAVQDSPNARIAAINVGDDINLDTQITGLGETQVWLRVLGITEGDNPGAAVLTTARSSAFLYSSTIEVG